MILTICPNCGAKNRINENSAANKQPICGRCGAKLNTNGVPNGQMPLEITDLNFQQTLQLAGNKPILIDCWAEWCPPCKMLAPTIDALAKESAARWLIGKLNVDQSPRTAGQFSISSIPTMLIFKNGQQVDRLVGLQPKAAIELKLTAKL